MLRPHEEEPDARHQQERCQLEHGGHDLDAPALARHADNPHVTNSLRDLYPSPYSVVDAVEFLARFSTADPCTVFAIANAAEVFGVIGYFPGQDVYRFSAEIGYWIGEPYWGRGIMTQAVDLLSQYVFETHPINRLYAGIFSTNPASVRVLEKAGYKCEGTHKCHVVKNGEIQDELVYARLRPGLMTP